MRCASVYRLRFHSPTYWRLGSKVAKACLGGDPHSYQGVAFLLPYDHLEWSGVSCRVKTKLTPARAEMRETEQPNPDIPPLGRSGHAGTDSEHSMVAFHKYVIIIMGSKRHALLQSQRLHAKR